MSEKKLRTEPIDVCYCDCGGNGITSRKVPIKLFPQVKENSITEEAADQIKRILSDYLSVEYDCESDLEDNLPRKYPVFNYVDIYVCDSLKQVHSFGDSEKMGWFQFGKDLYLYSIVKIPIDLSKIDVQVKEKKQWGLVFAVIKS